MQSNSNAGIITYRETKMPKLLSMLAYPKLDSNITITGENQEINIFIFDCPVNGDKLDKKRYKQLRELLEKSKVKFLVERFDAKVHSNVTQKKNEPHYLQLLAEIKAIKQLAAIIKLSQDRAENLLTGNIGFIMEDVDIFKIDLLSEEASNIMLYEGPSLDEKLKIKLHNDFMEKKGVSIVFTKDIKSIILYSSIISIDEGVDLREYSPLLQDKILLGKSKTDIIKSIDNIILWTDELNKVDLDEIPVIYNSEILSIMRYYHIKLDIIDFIKMLPYIYFDPNK
ncbi:MAG: hypothetical protein A2Y23_05850 [Clostridiales bacterium GWB2_37_7]|nr:MAG: hypothetical protein A2Y23_05850 [Clostridiales bacterium GWB2_37_7]